jgi:O-antigen/teichoic acid export membrane protein
MIRQFTRTVVRNSAFEMAGQLVIKTLSFLFSVLVVRNLGPEAFGQYSAVIAFGMVFAFFSDLGLAPYAVREIARMRDQADAGTRIGSLWANITVLRLILSIITIVIIISTAILTNRPPTLVNAIALSTIGLLCYSIAIASTILSGHERFDLTAQGNIANQIVFVTLGALALWLGFGYIGLIVASLAGSATLAFIYVRNAHSLGVRMGRIEPRTWFALLRASFPFGLISLALGLSYKFDSFLLNITRGDTETGLYNAAYNLVFSTVVLSNVINTALYPSLSRAVANGSNDLNSIYERAMRYLMLIALPIAVGVSALAHQIVPFLYKSNYAAAIPALQIVIWVVPLMYMSEFLGYIVVIKGEEKSAARAVLASTSVNLIMNLILVPRFGFLAAAVMTVVTEFVLVSQYVWMLRAHLRQLDLRPLTHTLVAVLTMGAIVLAGRDLALLLIIPLGALVYLGVLLAFRVIGIDEWRFIAHARRRKESPSPE